MCIDNNPFPTNTLPTMSTLMNLQEIKSFVNTPTLAFARIQVEKSTEGAVKFLDASGKPVKDKDKQDIYVLPDYNRAWNNDDRIAVYAYDSTMEELIANPSERKFLVQTLEAGDTDNGSYHRYRIVIPRPNALSTNTI
jgi:hypothetical protein